jgi:hypothetical protein
MKIFLTFFFTLVVSCTHNSTENLEPDNTKYFPVLEKESRKASFYKDFETIFLINATRISPNFKNAFTTRKNQTVPEFKSLLDKQTDRQISFVLSLYTPFEDLEKLQDSSQWNVSLQTKNKNFKKKSITKLSKKNHWEKFFPYVNTWTNEYLITFTLDKSQEMPEKVSLLLSNVRSKSTLTW